MPEAHPHPPLPTGNAILVACGLERPPPSAAGVAPLPRAEKHEFQSLIVKRRGNIFDEALSRGLLVPPVDPSLKDGPKDPAAAVDVGHKGVGHVLLINEVFIAVRLHLLPRHRT
jgi:hypothetical protein